jgi:hypothetical protein
VFLGKFNITQSGNKFPAFMEPCGLLVFTRILQLTTLLRQSRLVPKFRPYFSMRLSDIIGLSVPISPKRSLSLSHYEPNFLNTILYTMYNFLYTDVS